MAVEITRRIDIYQYLEMSLLLDLNHISNSDMLNPVAKVIVKGKVRKSNDTLVGYY